MSFFKKIWLFFKKFASPKPISQTPFPTPPIDWLIGHFDVLEKAKTSAQKNEPPSNALHLDKNEDEIKQSLFQTYKKSEEKYHSVMRTYIEEYQGKIEIIRQDVLSLQDKANIEIKILMTKFFGYYESSQRNHRKIYTQIEHFKKINKVTRPAQYPESKSLYIAIILCIFAAELGLNINFFAKGSELGLLGGLLECSAIALINLLIGFIFGNILRQVNSQSIFRKIIGISSFIFSISFLTAFNLICAHYRLLFETQGRDYAMENAISVAIENIGITNLNSVFLFILGMLCSLLVMYKGYHYDDPIPGYSDLDKKLKKAENDYADERIEITDELNEKYHKLENDFEKRCIELGLLHKNVSGKYAAASECESMYRNHLVHMNNALDKLISIYRDENKKIRSTPAPSYFSHQESLEISLETNYLNLFKKELELFNAAYSNTIKELEKTKSEMLQHIKNALEKVNSCKMSGSEEE